jgi:hypothetical protein
MASGAPAAPEGSAMTQAAAPATSLHLVEEAFAGCIGTRVPVAHIGFSSAAASLVLGREALVGGGVQQWREAAAWIDGSDATAEHHARSAADAAALTHATGQDLLRWEYWRLPEKPSERIDARTFLFGARAGSWRVRRYDPLTEMFPVVDQGGERITALETVEDLERHLDRLAEAPPPPAPLAAETAAVVAANPQHAIRFHAGYINIPYDEPVWLEAAVARPDLVARFLDLRTTAELARIAGLAAGGARLVFGGGDFASNQGPFYSPRVFRTLVLPRLQRITAACHAAGMRFLFASDGNLWPVADDLFGAAGVDGYYEIDRRAGMDLRRLRTRFPRLTLVGANVSSHTLAIGTPAEVAAEVRDCLDAARELGGILVGLSNYAMPETPAANLHALLAAVARWR